jgi:hypothetical protein
MAPVIGGEADRPSARERWCIFAASGTILILHRRPPCGKTGLEARGHKVASKLCGHGALISYPVLIYQLSLPAPSSPVHETLFRELFLERELG